MLDLGHSNLITWITDPPTEIVQKWKKIKVLFDPLFKIVFIYFFFVNGRTDSVFIFIFNILTDKYVESIGSSFV